MATEMNILLFHIIGHFSTTTECVTRTHRMCDAYMAACLHVCVSCVPDTS